ncbi:phosphoethanolamine transferase [Rickettsiales bacterium LUAb2]
MLKILKLPIITVNRYKFILWFSIIFTYIENIFTFVNKFNINQYEKISLLNNIYYIFTESLLSLAVLMLILCLLSFNKYLLKLICGLFLIISPIFIYYTVKYNIIIDEFLIGNVIEANPAEAPEFYSLWPIVITVIFGLIPFIYIARYIKFDTVFFSYKDLLQIKNWLNYLYKIFKFNILPIVILILILFYTNNKLISDRNSIKFALSNYLPVNYVSAIEQYIVRVRSGLAAKNHLIDSYKKYNFSFNNSKLKNKPLTVVLVIGESARLQNQHYAGYNRDTNQYTEQIPDIVYFKDMQSCGTFTRWSVPCMLSYKTRKQFNEPIIESNLISIFRELGFKTWWMSGQSAYEKQYNTLFASATAASEVYFMSALKPYVPSGSEVYDELLFRNIDKALQANKYKHKLLVIQLYGSHIKYEHRYPKQFIKFSPSCKSNICNDKTQLNDYDNSLLYSDYILAKLINKLKDTNSLVFYASDHGESLLVDRSGFLIHSAPYNIAPIEQKRVAAFMWMSKSLQKLLPQAHNNIKEYANLHISHDYIFHTLFGCIGVKADVLNPKLNLCNPVTKGYQSW